MQDENHRRRLYVVAMGRSKLTIVNSKAISRYPVPSLAELPADIRERMLGVQEKAGLIPDVSLTLAHRADEFRAFLICCNDSKHPKAWTEQKRPDRLHLC